MELTRDYRLSCSSLLFGNLLISEGMHVYFLYQTRRDYDNACDSGMFASYARYDPITLGDNTGFLLGLSFLELLAGASLILLSRRLFDKKKIIRFAEHKSL